MPNLLWILVLILIILALTGGLGYRGGWYGPHYGYGIGGLGIIVVILIVLVLVGYL